MAQRDGITVTISPGARVVRAAPGVRALDAARRAGLPIAAECGAQGACGKCRIVFSSSAPPPTDEDREHIPADQIADGVRLACRALLFDHASFAIPSQSLLPSTPMKKEPGATEFHVEADAAVRYVKAQMPPPDAADTRSDARRLLDALQLPADALPLPALRIMPSLLRDSNFQVDVVVHDDSHAPEILAIRSCGDNRPLIGAALDIGTTTLGLRLLDLESGECICCATAPNPQAAMGADVISRIHYAAENPGGLEELRAAVLASFNGLIADALEQTQCYQDCIYEMCVCGNPVMTQIFLGIDPQPIAASPFTPAAVGEFRVSAHEAGIHAHACARLFTLPGVAGYVGADAMGALLAANPGPDDLPALILDFGTNAEILLVCENAIYACAAAAGPALEGAHLSHGMGAWPGAVDRVDINAQGVTITTIDSAPACGLCGTGALDVLAGLLSADIVDATGRFTAPGAWAEALREHAATDHLGRPAFAVTHSISDSRILFTQADVRQLQLARGAIAAGTQVLFDIAGVRTRDIKAVLPAGALGSFLDPGTALAVGLVPNVPPGLIRYLGNAALAGAARALVNRAERERVRDLARRVTYIELSGRADFNAAFESCLRFS